MLTIKPATVTVYPIDVSKSGAKLGNAINPTLNKVQIRPAMRNRIRFLG